MGSWSPRGGIRRRRRSRFCGPIRRGSACGDGRGWMGSPSGRSGSRLSSSGSRDLAAGRGGDVLGVLWGGRTSRSGRRRTRPVGACVVSHRSEAGSLSGLWGGRYFRLPPAGPSLRGQAVGLIPSAGIPRSVRGEPAMGGKPCLSPSRWLSMGGDSRVCPGLQPGTPAISYKLIATLYYRTYPETLNKYRGCNGGTLANADRLPGSGHGGAGLCLPFRPP